MPQDNLKIYKECPKGYVRRGGVCVRVGSARDIRRVPTPFGGGGDTSQGSGGSNGSYGGGTKG